MYNGRTHPKHLLPNLNKLLRHALFFPRSGNLRRQSARLSVLLDPLAFRCGVHDAGPYHCSRRSRRIHTVLRRHYSIRFPIPRRDMGTGDARHRGFLRHFVAARTERTEFAG